MTKVSDQRFSFNGRGGSISFDDGTRKGTLGWERLVGDGATIVVYGNQCAWTLPERREMTRDEIRELVRAFATALPTTIEIAFPDGSEDIEP